MRFAFIDIRNEQTLEETARKLGLILELDFDEDDSGFYEEFPAYIAVSECFIYALLGFPKPEDDLQEEREKSFYELQIQPRGDVLPSATVIEKIINMSGILDCKIAM